MFSLVDGVVMANGTVSMPRGKGQGPCLRSSLFKDSYKRKSSYVVKDELAALELEDDEAKRAKEAKQTWIQYQRKMAQYAKERRREVELEDRILDYDPKQGGEYYNRLYSVDLTKFDLDEEC